MLIEQLIQDFVGKFTTYLDTSIKNTMVVLTGRNDLVFVTTVSWDYSRKFFVDISFNLAVQCIKDTEGDIATTGNYGMLSFWYNNDHKDLLARTINSGKVINVDTIQAMKVEAAMIRHLENQEPGFVGARIHIWDKGFRDIEGIVINLKDDIVLREQLDVYYPRLISFMDNHIQEMAGAILAFIDYYQEGDIIPEA